MDRRAFGLRPLAHVQHYSNLSDSSSEEENDKNYYQSRPQMLRPAKISDYQSSSDSSNDSDDSTYNAPRNLRNPVPRFNRRNRSTSSESDWNGSESSSSSIRCSRIKRSGTSGVSYKENSSGSSEKEEDEEDDSAEDEEEEDEPHGSYTADSVAGDGAEEVEAIEKVLCQRVGRKGATGTETISYNAELSGDPNANLDPDSEETEVQYLIKWKNWSHIHNTWESEESLLAQKVNGMKKLENFKRKESDLRLRTQLANREEIEYLVCQQEITEMLEAQHSLAERIIGSKVNSGSSEYLVKWEGLPYSNSTSEDAELIERLFPKVVEEYFYRRNNTCTPNPNNRALKYRPKFSALREQPARIGHENNMQLRDYQLDGVNWLLLAWCKGNSVILADEMGLGKTIQTLSFLEVLMSEYEIYGPFLILVPLSTITNWYREFRIWAPHINVIQYLGDTVSRSLIRQEEFSHPQTKKLKFNVLLTTYEILLKDRLILGGFSWAVLAVDEAHRLKNDESLLYKSLQPFRTNHRLLITGTPLQNSLKELWALLHFLMPKRYDRWEDFENRHRASDRNGFQSLHAELSPYLLRRVKKDVEKSLPAKTEQILRVEMSNLQKKYYKFILTKNYQELSKEVGGKVSSFINIVMELKKCCNHAFLVKEQENGYAFKNRFEMLVRGSGKMILLDKLLCRLKDTGHRVLIFSQMVRMLDILEEYLRLRRFGFQRLDGSIRGELRKQALDHFNAEGSPDFCFLLSTRAGGLGLNLATADTVIIFDSDWNPQNDLQAQARAHRIGQKNQVSVYRLVTKSSVEEDILERAKKKMVLDHLVIQRMDTTGRTVLNKDSQNSASSFSKDELNAILKFGAEELFKESDDEDAGDIQVDIDDILRRAETRNTEELNNTASGELLSCFKVVSFENLEEEDIEGHQSIVDQGKSWANIIPEIERRRIEDEELHRRLVELNPPPRSRKNCQKINYSEMNNSKKRKRDNDTSSDSDGVQQPKKRGRPKNTYSDLGGLSNSELKRLIKSLKKFGRPIERVHAIAQDGELLDKSQEQLEMLIRTIVRRCEEFQKESANQLENEDSLTGQRPQTFKLAKVIVNPKSILQSIADLEPLCIWAAQHDCKTLPESIHLRNPTFGFSWSRDDDVSLLKGVFQYGFGNWESIREDEKLGLNKILSEADRKSQYKRLASRVEYLLKKLHKYFDGTAVSKKSKSSVVSRKELPNQNNGELINGSMPEKKSKKSRKETNEPKDKETEKVARVESQPLMETDSVYGLSSSVFEKCKEDMRPVRKALKRLDDDADNTECLYIIGNHIKGLLERENDAVIMKQQRSNLWCFVSQFTKCTASEIYQIYRKILKARNPNADANNHSSKRFDSRSVVLAHSS